MNSELFQDLIRKVQAFSRAYVRNLVVAEKAVLSGQFNVAKSYELLLIRSAFSP
jgi:hypothetical protein